MSAPDLVLFNARIATLDAAMPCCGALAAQFGRIVALGEDDAVRALAGRGTRVLDAGGRRAIPGLIEGHAEPQLRARFAARFTALTGSDGVRGMQAACAALPPGRWGLFWSQAQGIGRAALDQVAGWRPVLVLAGDGQSAAASTAALATAGIHPGLPDPPGGRFGRDAGGALTGMAHGTALDMLLRAAGLRDEDLALGAGLPAAQQHYLSQGVTSVAAAFCSPAAAGAFRAARDAEQLRLRLGLLADASAMAALRQGSLGTGADDEWLSLLGVSLRAGAALAEHLSLADQAGLAAAIVPGDAYALDQVVATIEGLGPGCRARLHLVRDLAPALAVRLAQGGIAVGLVAADPALAVDGGDPLLSVQSGDPAFPLAPFATIAALAAAAPAGPARRDAVQTALAMHTRDAAAAQHQYHEKGTLALGRLADIAVLDTDILAAEPPAIAGTRVVCTIVGGAVMHGAL